VTITLANRVYACTPDANGYRYTEFPFGALPPAYNVYPIITDGIFDNDTIPNTEATYYIVTSDSPSRWTFFDGGAYEFDAVGATPGDYVATYKVLNWDGNGNHATATVTVTVTA
jgi:hypothetical protein